MNYNKFGGDINPLFFFWNGERLTATRNITLVPKHPNNFELDKYLKLPTVKEGEEFYIGHDFSFGYRLRFASISPLRVVMTCKSTKNNKETVLFDRQIEKHGAYVNVGTLAIASMFLVGEDQRNQIYSTPEVEEKFKNNLEGFNHTAFIFQKP